MRKLILFCAMILLVTGVSVQAQKERAPKPISPPIIEFDHNISVEDDATGSFLVFDPNTGAYKFHRCSDGFAMDGIGFVKVDGCAVYLEDMQVDHRVLVSVNECAQEAKAAVETFAPTPVPLGFTPVKEYMSDRDMRDNSLSCAPKK
ncbi:MAG: hypothetical protein WAU45_08375 [Blastocatellia bacterium]